MPEISQQPTGPNPATGQATSAGKVVALRQSQTPGANQHLQTLKKLEAEKTFLEQVLQFEAKMRSLDTRQSLKYFAVNELKKLISCRQVLMFTCTRNSRKLVTDTVSGLAVPDIRSPLLVWLAGEISRQIVFPGPLAEHSSQGALTQKARVLRLDPAQLAQDKPAFPFAMVSPLTNRRGSSHAVLVFLFDAPVQPRQQRLAERLSEAFSHNLLAFGGGNLSRIMEIPKPLKWIGLAACLLALFVPVPLTVLAPVIITAKAPSLITAPLSGVIEKIHVQPNSPVHSGDLLFSYEKTESLNQLEQARRDVAIAEAKYRRSNQDAFGAGNGRRDLAVAKAELDLAIAQLASIQRRSNLLDVTATRAGTVLFENVEKWTGRPVTTGERVFRIADPAAVEFRIDLPASEAIILSQMKTARVFLDSDPLNPLPMEVSRSSYEAEMSDAGVLGFPLYGQSMEQNNGRNRSLRIGLRGTAQLLGEKVPLWFFLFRKPLSFLRQYTGV